MLFPYPHTENYKQWQIDEIHKELKCYTFEEDLKEYTAVSSVIAGQMAEGAAKVSGSDITIATTGYAGPGAAEDGTPAGTVYIGVFYNGETDIRKFCFDGSRNDVRKQTVDEAIKLALQKLT